jgi:hypothetical protein
MKKKLIIDHVDTTLEYNPYICRWTSGSCGNKPIYAVTCAEWEDAFCYCEPCLAELKYEWEAEGEPMIFTIVKITELDNYLII